MSITLNGIFKKVFELTLFFKNNGNCANILIQTKIINFKIQKMRLIFRLN